MIEEKEILFPKDFRDGTYNIQRVFNDFYVVFHVSINVKHM